MKSQLVIDRIFLMNDKVSKWYENTKNVDEMLDWRPALKEWEKSVSKLFSPGSRILDIGCGLGREAFALHDLGFEVVGLANMMESIWISLIILLMLCLSGHKLSDCCMETS